MAVGIRLHTNLLQREQAVWTSKIRYQIKEFSIWYMGRFKPLGSLNSLLSYVPQLSGPNPVSLFTLDGGRHDRWLLLSFSAPQQSPQGMATSAGLEDYITVQVFVLKWHLGDSIIFFLIFIILIIWLHWVLIMHVGSLISLVPLRDHLVVAGKRLVAGYGI